MALSFSRARLRLLSTACSLLILPATLHAGQGLDTLVGEYNADLRDLHSSQSVPWSPESMQREEALLADWEKRLDAMDYEPLDVTARIDWHLLDTQIHERQDDLKQQRRQLQEMQPVLAFAAPLQQLMLDRAHRELADGEKSAAVLSQAAADIKALRKTLEAGKARKEGGSEGIVLTPVIALRSAGAVEDVRSGLDAWYGLYDGFQPDFTWWTEKPRKLLLDQLDALTGYLKKDLAGVKGEPDDPLIGDPIGAEGVRAALQAEMIPYTAEELIAMADREFTWCEAQMQQAATAMGCATRAEALAKVKDLHAPPGGQAAQALTEAKKAIQFLKDHDLVSIPPLAEETWGISMLGTEQQKTLPYAVYGQPRIMVAYATDGMSYEDKLMSMRGNNYAFLHIVTPHELIPGHHLQGYMAKRQAAYRGGFSTPFLVEGWALHWEMLLWDQGYLATPEEKVGALFWRMHRCARILTTLKFHLGQMTPQEMIDFLVDRVGHERAGATSEVRRYIGGAYGPLYQVAYMTGGKQLTALQHELCGGEHPERGIQRFPQGSMSLRDFHDQVLRQGPVPIEMIRAALENQSLPKDWKPQWKFMDRL